MIEFVFNYYTVPRYAQMRSFKNGLAMVQNKKGLWGFIDKKGEEVIPCQFTYVEDFSEDRAVFSKGNFKGYIDKTGQEIIPARFLEAMPFNEGLAVVKRDDGFFYYIDKRGELVSEGFKCAAQFNSGHGLVVKKTGQVGYFDGQKVTTLTCRESSSFSDGYAVITGLKKKIFTKKLVEAYSIEDSSIAQVGECHEGMFRLVDYADRIGYMNSKFETVLPCCLKDAGDFSDGRARITLDNNVYAFIDEEGTIRPIKNRSLKYVGDYHCGRALVRSDAGYGFIDKDGRDIIDCRFAQAEDFSEDVALVQDKKGQSSYIRKDGGLEISPLITYGATLKYGSKTLVIEAYSEEELKAKKIEALRTVREAMIRELDSDIESAMTGTSKSI